MRNHIREGAARQAVATADLLRRGFEVWQEVGPSSVDLIAGKHGFLLRVEVKGSHRAPQTNCPVGATTNSSHIDCKRFDIIAFVELYSVRYNRSALHAFNEASKELVGDEVQSKKTTNKNIARAQRLMEAQ